MCRWNAYWWEIELTSYDRKNIHEKIAGLKKEIKELQEKIREEIS